VPLHASASDGVVRAFMRDAFSHPPTDPPGSVDFDLLLVLSGNASHHQELRLRAVVNATLQRAAPAARLFVERMPLRLDKYDHSRATADWSAGPNEEFYSVMHGAGELWQRHTRRYTHLLQMETDVVTLSPGWLTAVMEPVAAGGAGSDFLLAGAVLGSQGCIYDDAEKKCNPLAKEP